jgi:hypothetical protein
MMLFNPKLLSEATTRKPLEGGSYEAFDIGDRIDANVPKTTFEEGYAQHERCDLHENRAARA